MDSEMIDDPKPAEMHAGVSGEKNSKSCKLHQTLTQMKTPEKCG